MVSNYSHDYYIELKSFPKFELKFEKDINGEKAIGDFEELQRNCNLLVEYKNEFDDEIDIVLDNFFNGSDEKAKDAEN
ncbi:uncharacterized protein ASCRUDRAFT_74171, partial [Ascoidea rubescens DSM 1968]